MQNWNTVNNSKHYAPYFLFFLDCVNQLINMNPYEFEFTGFYLAHLGFHTFTSKYYETVFPIYTIENGLNHHVDCETSLVSIF